MFSKETVKNVITYKRILEIWSSIYKLKEYLNQIVLYSIFQFEVTISNLIKQQPEVDIFCELWSLIKKY